MITQSTGEAIGERVVSSSGAMRFVMQEIARAAERSVHVLLSGERGTGRETLARAIHARGRHNHGRFVAIDCAKFSAHELEAHLFATDGNHGTTISLDDVLAIVRLDGQATWFAVGGSLREARARFETEYIAAVVAHHHGRIPEQ